MIRPQLDPQFLVGMTWDTVQSENIQIRIGGKLVSAYLETPTDASAIKDWWPWEPIVLKVLTVNEIRLLYLQRMEIYLREHVTNDDPRELRFIFRSRLISGDWLGSEDLPNTPRGRAS